ncbi:MAG: MYG1 family protein [Nitrosomonadaceae bacterium]|nr:MYG1 family protein [Nitrosomonadaceae bacterium]
MMGKPVVPGLFIFMPKTFKAITHSSVFHADDVMACAVLDFVVQHDLEVVRTRNLTDELLASANFVVDVGGKYDQVKYFDHHQPEGAGKRDSGGSYAAFGLIWKHFGMDYLRELRQRHPKLEALPRAELLKCHKHIDETFVAMFDAHDTGELVGGVCRNPANNSQVFDSYNLPQLVALFNPTPMIHEFTEEQQDKMFAAILPVAQSILSRVILKFFSRGLGVLQLDRLDDGQQPILVLEEFCEWQGDVVKRPHIIYVLSPNPSNGHWSVFAAKSALGFGLDNLRKPFPAHWAGLTDGELAAASGVIDAVFCHRNLFIASARSYEGAKQLAQKALDYKP